MQLRIIRKYGVFISGKREWESITGMRDGANDVLPAYTARFELR
jgi:hypothetical protein